MCIRNMWGVIPGRVGGEKEEENLQRVHVFLIVSHIRGHAWGRAGKAQKEILKEGHGRRQGLQEAAKVEKRGSPATWLRTSGKQFYPPCYYRIHFQAEF